MAEWEKKTLRLKDGHGWQARPGCNVLVADRGRVLLGGEDVSRLPVHRRAQRGMGRTFQRIELFAESTVREHLLIAERMRRGDGALWKDLIGRGRPKADLEAAIDAIERIADFALVTDVAEMDINPLIVCEKDAWVADALIVRGQTK